MSNGMQFDLFSFLNGESVDFTMEEPPKKETKKKKPATTPAAVEEDAVDDNEEDLSLEEEDMEETSAPKKSKSSGTSKKKKGLTGDSKVLLPLTCYGRNWKVRMEGLGEKSINEVISELYHSHGILEVAHKEVSPIGDAKNISSGVLFFTSPNKESDTNLSLFGNGSKATFVDGMEQMPFAPEQFPDRSKEEVSVLDAQLQFEVNFPAYKNQGISYCASSVLGIPVIQKTLAKDQEVTLPAEVVVCGQKVGISKEDFPFSEKVLGKDLVEAYFPDMPVTLKVAGNVIFGEFTGTAVSNLKKPGQTDGKESVIKELISLPCSCYFVTLNQSFSLTSEMFGGKDKITKEEVLDLLKTTYSILRNKDRKVEVIYAREQNLVSVALTSGTKGAAKGAEYVLPETESTGLFQLIRDARELAEVKLLPYFLGNYVPKEGPSQRVEVCPHGIFTATKGEGPELLKIKTVSFESKLPKIPSKIFQAVLEDFKSHPETERVVRICWNPRKREYFLSFPFFYENTGKEFIQYHFAMPSQNVYTVMTIHSHNTMPAYFSSVDDRDEAITGLYGVVGTVHETPTFCFRAGVEGVFQELQYTDLFEEV